DAMLCDFKKNKVHMAIVADEAGRMDGVVTLEDVLEKIVGEIHDEFDADESANGQQGAAEQEETAAATAANGESGVWTVKSDLDIDEFNRKFAADLDPSHADTLGGWFVRKLGEFPEVGDQIEEGEFVFTVVKSDDRRIILLEVRRQAKLSQSPPDRDD
ncbi:MAG: hypothetical protein OXC81_02950, partial [Betaproteobacteria bacterium]|nr:hypothetical protein [Betaproteobacteria bacterium]